MSTQGTPAPIKFRCSQCEKVLKVSRSKAGHVVTCPACSTELIVPNPPVEDHSPGPEPAVSATAEPSPFAFLNLNLEPGHASAPAPTPAPSAVGAAFPLIQTEPPAHAEPPARPTPTAAKAPPPPPPAPAPAPAPEPFFPGIRTEPAPAAEAPAASAFPLIQAAPEPIRPEPAASRPSPPVAVSGRDAPRRNDVVLPRTAVVLWTFMVLVATIFAFTAGVLLGHFVWLRPPAP